MITFTIENFLLIHKICLWVTVLILQCLWNVLLQLYEIIFGTLNLTSKSFVYGPQSTMVEKKLYDVLAGCK